MKRWSAACALALCACAGDLASPFSAVAITYDVPNQTFKLAQVRINSLTSLRHLRGSAGTVTAGGTVRVDAAAIRAAGATVDSLRKAFIEAQPSSVDLTWNLISVPGGEVVYPEDFASLELLSTYYNLERARTELSNRGLSALPARPVVAHAAIADENGISPLPDGELYYAPLATFFMPAATPQGQMPSQFNVGAVAHAVAHEAIEELVWGGAVLPAPELSAANDAATLTARHVARSMAEGIADYLGVTVSNDDRWFSHSLQQDADSRALDSLHCGTPDMLDALSVDDARAPYNPYPLGSVIASALWDEGSSSTNQNTAQGVLAALTELGARAANGGLDLAGVLDALVASSPDTQRADLCGRFFDRFRALSLAKDQLPSCAGLPVVDHQECQ